MASPSSAVAAGDGLASAIAAGDGLASNNEEVISSQEQRLEGFSSPHTLANGCHDYRVMKNGKRRPSAVRDFPKNIIPANRISCEIPDGLPASEEKTQVQVSLATSKGKKEQKQIKEVSPATDKGTKASAESGADKEGKGPAKKASADQKSGKDLTPTAKRTQLEVFQKESQVSPDTAKPRKEKEALTEKTQKMPTNSGKSVEKNASVIASTALDVSLQVNEPKSKKENITLTEKAKKTPTKAGKGVGKKTSVNAAAASDASLQKDIVVSQGEMEAMDGVQQQETEKPQEENEQAEGEKRKKSQPIKRKSGIRDLPESVKQGKDKVAKKGIGQDLLAQDLDTKKGDIDVSTSEDLEIITPDAGTKEDVGIKEKAVADIAKAKENVGTKEEAVADNGKANNSLKKKRPLQEPEPSDRSAKTPKIKSPNAAQTSGKPKDVESDSKTKAPVVTPKAMKATKKPSTPSNSSKKVRRSAGKSVKPTTTLTDVGDARKFVLESLRLFDAVRRKFVQDEEKNGKPARGTRADLQAATLLKDQNATRGGEKGEGSFPGILVGDIFLFRTELSFARLHGPIQAGIEYLTTKDSEYNSPVAISIISNVGQDGDDNGEELIYTGQGGRSADNKQIAHQKLERGNLALEGSRKFNVPIRVIRGIKDVNSPTGKVYVYDGLYRVQETYTAQGSGGFDEYKFRLQRLPDQPELGSDTLKVAADLKSQAPSSRKDVVVADISKGQESQPICVENTMDEDKGPAAFTYATKVIYPDDVDKLKSTAGCKCKGACNPSSSCSCFSQNGDELPYLNGGYLVRQKDYVFECGSKCSCAASCRNRAPERGLKFRLEVFKTADRGWGVRPLEVIPAGSFVCEYIGKMVADEEEIKTVSDREHVLFTRRLRDTIPRWGDVPSILPDRSSSTVRPDAGNPELIIDASCTGNVARFINHSCSPNLLIQKVLSDHQDLKYPQFKLFALDNIPPLRELTFDYGYPSEQELALEQASVECLCGSTDCRGKLYL
eukprot:c29269_g1_i1 orf=490-3504(+)